MCVALAALEARVLATGKDGERSIAFADFHRLPDDTPNIDTNLRSDEIITAIELPPKGFAANYSYLKIRDRLSYAFALVSIAVGLEIADGTIKEARLALGGVAHKPWRNHEAEAQLSGAPATRESFHAGGRNRAARCPRFRPQRLQDRAGAARHSAHADAGGARNPAVASGQADQVTGRAP